MKIALKEAKKAFNQNEVPVGAIIVYNDTIIAKAYNEKEQKKSIFAHAEILAIHKATKKLKNWRLENCDIYVTLEPCPMCTSAIQQSRIRKIYYGVENSDKKNHEIFSNICKGTNTNKSTAFCGKILEDQCAKILKDFFQKQRNKNIEQKFDK